MSRIKMNKDINIAFVVQRYGKEVMGGSELHCRQVAEKMVEHGFKCAVFTTAAQDYITWENVYSPGSSELNGVEVKRYQVSKPRDIRAFNQYSDWIFSHPHTREQEVQWLEQQGPFSPDLIKALKQEQKHFDVFIFFTYLYFNTYWGLKSVDRPKILVPTAHDEPPLHLDIMKEVFDQPDAFIFNTDSEKRMLYQNFDLKRKVQDVVGVGIDIPEPVEVSPFLKKYDLAQPFILYAGRIEKGKGCQELIHYFEKYSEQRAGLNLVLMGKRLMELPQKPELKCLGFVPLSDKEAGMQAAAITVHPSHLESLCMAALESLASGTPILVQEKTLPLKDHCLKSRGGLWYSNYKEFEAAADLLLQDEKLRKIMGKNGRSYVIKNYSWPNVIDKYMNVFKDLGFDSD